MKDRFSQQSENYKKYRPSYPEDLFAFITGLIDDKQCAWDCGTGNGQVAVKLSSYFETVYATDISKEQLLQAPVLPKVIYKAESAEHTSFPDHSFDLITVAQAIHWFDFEKFYTEVKRTLKPGGLLAVMGYALIKTELPINNVIDRFYTEIIGPYWDKERRYIDERYETIPFPFEEIEAPVFNNHMEWTLEELIGYLNTWSAVKLYEKKENINPVSLIEKELKEQWGDAHASQKITFPILLRIGKV